MGLKVHAGSVPTTRLIPEGFFNLRIASAEEAITKTGILMYRVEFRVEAPEVCINRGTVESFFFGKRARKAPEGASGDFAAYQELEDLMGEDPLNHRFNPSVAAFKKMLVAINHPQARADGWDMDDIIDSLTIKNPKEQFRVGAYIRNFIDEGGFERNRMSFFYEIGTQEPQLKVEKEAKAAPMAAAAPTPVKPRTRVAAETINDDDDEELV